MSKTTHSLLKIYASSTDRLGAGLLYEEIVYRAREAGISGVTVYRGVMGYGLSSHIHTSKFWELTEKLPVVIEMVDEADKIADFYEAVRPELEGLAKGCLVTTGPVTVMMHKPGKKSE